MITHTDPHTHTELKLERRSNKITALEENSVPGCLSVDIIFFSPINTHHHYKAIVLGYCTQHLLLTIAVGKIEAMVAPASQVVQRMKPSMQEEDLP